MKWWGKMIVPVQKVWTKASYRLGYRKNGLVKLGQDFRSCEYEDVHILWYMLKRNDTNLTTRKKVPFWNILQWVCVCEVREIVIFQKLIRKSSVLSFRDEEK